jgi:hypothetical protein
MILAEPSNLGIRGMGGWFVGLALSKKYEILETYDELNPGSSCRPVQKQTVDSYLILMMGQTYMNAWSNMATAQNQCSQMGRFGRKR